MLPKMSDKDYDLFKSVIEQANKDDDKEALKSIRKQLIAKYGLDNERVRRLLDKFRYHKL